MIPREDIASVLEARLRDVLSKEEILELARKIQGLEAGWQEMDVSHRDMGYSMSVNCPDMCWLADQIYKGAIIKLYRKVEQPVAQ